MGKTDVIAKLCEKNEEFLKTLEKAEQVLKNPNVRGGVLKYHFVPITNTRVFAIFIKLLLKKSKMTMN